MNVHSIAVQVPMDRVRRRRQPVRRRRPGVGDRGVDVGVAAGRCGCSATGARRTPAPGPFTQVSRLGNPLFNEVIVPMAKKDLWNSLPPREDKRFAEFVAAARAGALLPALYPGVFPNLAALTRRRSRGPTWWRSCSPASRPG